MAAVHHLELIIGTDGYSAACEIGKGVRQGCNNVKKTKVMCISHTGNHKLKILVEGQRVEQVTQFKYLGSVISSDGYCEKDIRSRIVMGKQAFGNKKKLLTGDMNLDLKKKIVKCTIWSVVLYGAETWTMTQADRERLEAFEMWIWRRMLKIS